MKKKKKKKREENSNLIYIPPIAPLIRAQRLYLIWKEKEKSEKLSVSVMPDYLPSSDSSVFEKDRMSSDIVRCMPDCPLP